MKTTLTNWVLMLGIVLGLAACKIDVPKEKLTSFETMVVEQSDIVLPLKYSAKMKGMNDVTITPQVSGQLMQICVTEGQQVKKGTILFKIDSRDAELELESATANLLAAEAEENSAKLEYESNKNLFEKKIVSRYMLDNSENSYKQAQASVSQARASVNRAKVNLGFCTITAPVTGVIGEIPVRTGDQVSQGTRLTMVSGNETMYAEFSVTEDIVEMQVSNNLTKADTKKLIAELPDATFIMKNGTEYPYKGRVTSLTGMVDSSTGSLSCKATFPNPEGHLYSGIQGTVILPFDEKDVIVIPQAAVVRLQDKSLVYKVQPDSTAVSVIITTESADNGKDVIVTGGLNIGDRIVTIGANNVQEGQRVLYPEESEAK